MTVVTRHEPAGPEPADHVPAVSSPAGPAVVPAVPRLADGVELLGEYQNSGYRQPPSLVRRADGQVIQMSPLLYQVTVRIDGSRDAATIAELVSADIGRTLTADQVGHVVAARLIPLGIVARPGRPTVAPTANPLLALRARGTLLPEPVANAAGRLLRPLFHQPLVIAVVGTTAALDYWLFFRHGLGAGLAQVMRDPLDLLVVVALTVISAVFHECGHATGCRYGGARPGRIGVGIYLVWPAFFTNVTDSYRLSRGGRLRTDLGGLYFNLVFMLALAGLYAVTSAPVLLLVIALTHLEMLEQLLPFVRFDGYFILSDLVGVPDLFARIAPVVRGALGQGPRDPRVTGLRRRARIIVTGWVLCVIPLLAVGLGYLVLHLPEINRALWQSGSRQAHLMASALDGHRYPMAAIDALSVALVALSLAGTLYILTGLARRFAVAGLRWSAGRPARRVLAAAGGLTVLAALAVTWTAQGQFHGW